MLILSHVQNNNWNVFSHNRDVCYILAMVLSCMLHTGHGVVNSLYTPIL